MLLSNPTPNRMRIAASLWDGGSAPPRGQLVSVIAMQQAHLRMSSCTAERSCGLCEKVATSLRTGTTCSICGRAIFCESGLILIQRACLTIPCSQYHASRSRSFRHTSQSSFCSGGHFYLMSHLCDILIAKQDDYRAPGDVGTNQSIAVSYAYMVWYGLELLRPHAELAKIYGLSTYRLLPLLKYVKLKSWICRNPRNHCEPPGHPTISASRCFGGYGTAP
jgi:hypothetical protein